MSEKCLRRSREKEAKQGVRCYWVHLPVILLSCPKTRGKIKTSASTSSTAPKPKRAKVLTRRSKPIGTAEVPKLIQSVEASLLATKATSVMAIEASAGPVEEPGPKKTGEQPKLLSCPIVTELPKLSATATTTPRKRRMASVLDAVLEFVKMPTPVPTKTSGGKI
jgi:hypothetical protein